MNIYIYYADNEEQYPADLHKLVESGLIEQSALRSPTDERSPAETNSYVYIRQRASDDPRNVLAYERPENNPAEIPVLFNDYHLETVCL